MATSASSLGPEENELTATAVTHDVDDEAIAMVIMAGEGSEEKQQEEDGGGGHSPGGCSSSSAGAKGSEEQTRYLTPEAPIADASVSRDKMPSPPVILKKKRRRKKKTGKKAGVVGEQSGNRSSPALNVEDLFMTISTLQVERYSCFVS